MSNTWSQSAGKSYAYILGVYLGDGAVTVRSDKNVNFRLGTIDEDFAIATSKALLEVTGRQSKINKVDVYPKSSKPNYDLRCACGDFGLHLKDVTCEKHVIPDFVHQWDDELKREFVSGLMDSEGFVAEGKNRITLTPARYFMGFGCCDIWFFDFVRILESIGIKVNKVRQETLKSGKTMRRFTIKIKSWITSGCKFNIQRKQRRVDEYASYEPYTLRSRYPRRLSPETTRQTPCLG